MAKKVIYWITTILVAVLSFIAGFSYLSGSHEVVQGFAHVGYPQQLRVILGVAKVLGGITLLVPGFLTLKEWAYAGFTFAWICAVIAHLLAGDHREPYTVIVLLILLFISYFTRPASRRVQAKSLAA
jgi:uncharacterized membrane protein YphA (DoxX/SURF4 family)